MDLSPSRAAEVAERVESEPAKPARRRRLARRRQYAKSRRIASSFLRSQFVRYDTLTSGRFEAQTDNWYRVQTFDTSTDCNKSYGDEEEDYFGRLLPPPRRDQAISPTGSLTPNLRSPTYQSQQPAEQPFSKQAGRLFPNWAKFAPTIKAHSIADNLTDHSDRDEPPANQSSSSLDSYSLIDCYSDPAIRKLRSPHVLGASSLSFLPNCAESEQVLTQNRVLLSRAQLDRNIPSIERVVRSEASQSGPSRAGLSSPSCSNRLEKSANVTERFATVRRETTDLASSTRVKDAVSDWFFNKLSVFISKNLSNASNYNQQPL